MQISSGSPSPTISCLSRALTLISANESPQYVLGIKPTKAEKMLEKFGGLWIVR